MQEEPVFLRAQAEKCRRLAKSIDRSDVKTALLAMAKEYEARAEAREQDESRA